MSRNAGNNPGIISILQLGITNAFFLDSMDIGMDKSGNLSTAASGVVMFNPAFGANAPSAYFRGVNGATDPTSRVTWWGDGDGNSSASSSNGGGGTNDFSLGKIDALINVLSLGARCGQFERYICGTAQRRLHVLFRHGGRQYGDFGQSIAGDRHQHHGELGANECEWSHGSAQSQFVAGLRHQHAVWRRRL